MTITFTSLAAHPGHGHVPADLPAHYSEVEHLGGTLVLAVVVGLVLYIVITALRDRERSGR